MTTLAGRDSAYCPPLPVLQGARSAGVAWWGLYVSGQPPEGSATHVWTPAEVASVRAAGLAPVALHVPTYGLAEDPTAAAQQAVAAAMTRGIYGTVGLDTEEAMVSARGLQSWVNTFTTTVLRAGWQTFVYAGAHYVPGGVPGWFPFWGTSQLPSSTDAVQYGPGKQGGYSVDINLAGLNFPLGRWQAAPPKPLPVPVPPPGVPITYPEDHLLAIPASVDFINHRGWINVPAPYTAAQVVNVVVLDQDPGIVGAYAPIPLWDGNATNGGTLEFGDGPYGPAPDGVYGLLVWVATS